MKTWLQLTDECGNLGMTMADNGQQLGRTLSGRATGLDALEIVEGEARWLPPDMARQVCGFTVTEPSVPGQWVRLYELAMHEGAEDVVTQGRNPWPVRNPGALYGKALLRAKRLRNAGSVVVLARAERALVIAPPEVLNALARHALSAGTFDPSHRASLALTC